jgi:hypothetical protein
MIAITIVKIILIDFHKHDGKKPIEYKCNSKQIENPGEQFTKTNDGNPHIPIIVIPNFHKDKYPEHSQGKHTLHIAGVLNARYKIEHFPHKDNQIDPIEGIFQVGFFIIKKAKCYD